MKQVSISRRVLNAMLKSGAVFKTSEECQKFVDKVGEGVVAEAYEMEGEHGYERLAYNIFRGYVVNW